MFKAIQYFLVGSLASRESTLQGDPFMNAIHETQRQLFEPGYGEKVEEERRRRDWLRKRLWHNGEHANCCKKCFQAGYVIAAALAERTDLIAKYPELIPVFHELSRNGMVETAFAKTRGYSAEAAAGRTSPR